MDWWNELTVLQRFFASIAIPATFIMVIQFVLLIFGLSHGEGADGVDAHADLHIHDGGHDVCDGHDILHGHSHDLTDHVHDGSDHHNGDGQENINGLRLLTLRGIIAFLSIGGWMGVSAISWGMPVPAVFILAFCAGSLALYFVAWTLRAALRLQQSGNVVSENAIGIEGKVYLPIPSAKGGKGKVSVIVQERFCEFDAVTKTERVLKTGESIIVTGVEPGGELIVEPKDNTREGLIINN
jgi:membrane protein implicated in regulation of membrane protease activity